jgi:hypothetical protein
MFKKYGLLFIALTAFTYAQPLGDFVPLKIHTQWTYLYRSTEQEYGDIVNRVKTTIDSGIVRYSIISAVNADSATLWTVEEKDSLVTTIHDYLKNSDTVFATNMSSEFILSEYPDSLHTIKSQSNIPIFEFPHTWTGWGSVTSSEPTVRFGKDSSDRISTEKLYGAGPIVRWDSLRFQKDRGLIYVQSYVDKGPSTLYRFDWNASLVSMVTGVLNSGQSVVPEGFLVLQNYPNPFNPSTTISYAIPQSGVVTVKVFDLLGREVATLANEYQSKGRYNVVFDANHLASGIYIYRVQAGKYSATRKMQLLK